MPVGLYMDVHVPQAVTTQLRARQVDVVTAQEDGTTLTPDDRLLERVTELGRVLFTQDVRFKAMADQWNRDGRPFSGLVFGHQMGGTIGQFVQDLELIAKATDPGEWANSVERVPFPR